MRLVSALSGLLHLPRAHEGVETSRAVNRLMRPADAPRELDPLVIWPTVALLLIGLVMVYSSSIALAEESRFTGHQSHYFLLRHAVFLLVGIVASLVAFRISLRQWQQLAPWLFMTGLVLLIVVLIPGVGREVNGAQRWLPFGPINLQPSELMKLFVTLYAADYTVRKLPDMNSFLRGFAPMAAMVLSVGCLLLLEPDFGAFVVIAAIAFGVMFIGGINVRIFALLATVAVIGFILLIWLSPYRRDRIFGFMDPWQDAYGRGYQLSHALIAFGRGEWFGVGLGGSVEKLFYLPEAHTDFLLAVIAEEFGFIGVAVVVALFGWLIVKAFLIGHRAAQLERNFCALVAQGIGIWIGVQALINMGVNVGLLPTKGLTLPFLSFGGSGIIANCLAVAILLRIDWEHRQMMRGKTF